MPSGLYWFVIRMWTIQYGEEKEWSFYRVWSLGKKKGGPGHLSHILHNN